jgi:hypothetical protein
MFLTKVFEDIAHEDGVKQKTLKHEVVGHFHLILTDITFI